MSEKIKINCAGKEIELDVNDLDQEQTKENMKEKYEEQMAVDGKLPETKTIFSIENQLFNVTYVNPAKKRITAEWYNDRSKPFTGLPEVESTCTIHGKIFKVIDTNKSKKRINIEPISN